MDDYIVFEGYKCLNFQHNVRIVFSFERIHDVIARCDKSPIVRKLNNGKNFECKCNVSRKQRTNVVTNVVKNIE